MGFLDDDSVESYSERQLRLRLEHLTSRLRELRSESWSFQGICPECGGNNILKRSCAEWCHDKTYGSDATRAAEKLISEATRLREDMAATLYGVNSPGKITTGYGSSPEAHIELKDDGDRSDG